MILEFKDIIIIVMTWMFIAITPLNELAPIGIEGVAIILIIATIIIGYKMFCYD